MPSPWSVQEDGGGDATTLDAAINLASAGEVINIEGEWDNDDSAQVILDVDNLTINVLGASRHPGYYDATLKHHRLRRGGGHVISQTTATSVGVTVDGLMIVQSGTGSSDECWRCEVGTGKTNNMDNCIAICETNTTQQDCWYTGHNKDVGTYNWNNCMASGAGRAGIHSQNSYSADDFGGTFNVNSCTICKNGQVDGTTAGNFGGGIFISRDLSARRQDSVVSIQNCIFMDNDDNSGRDLLFNSPTVPTGYPEGGTGTWSVANTVCSDVSLDTTNEPATAQTANLKNYTLAATDQGAGNFVIVNTIATGNTADWRLKDLGNSNNKAQDAHTDDEAYGLTIPSTDIVGTSRPQNTSHDIGAFEVAVAVAAERVHHLPARTKFQKPPHYKPIFIR